MTEDVIFLIDSKAYNKDLMRISLEKLTNYKVYNFFSIDEATLYANLNPKLIIYSQDSETTSSRKVFNENVKFVDISKRINQAGKDHILKYSSIGDRLSQLLNNN